MHKKIVFLYILFLTTGLLHSQLPKILIVTPDSLMVTDGTEELAITSDELKSAIHLAGYEIGVTKYHLPDASSLSAFEIFLENTESVEFENQVFTVEAKEEFIAANFWLIPSVSFIEYLYTEQDGSQQITAWKSRIVLSCRDRNTGLFSEAVAEIEIDFTSSENRLLQIKDQIAKQFSRIVYKLNLSFYAELVRFNDGTYGARLAYPNQFYTGQKVTALLVPEDETAIRRPVGTFIVVSVNGTTALLKVSNYQGQSPSEIILLYSDKHSIIDLTAGISVYFLDSFAIGAGLRLDLQRSWAGFFPYSEFDLNVFVVSPPEGMLVADITAGVSRHWFISSVQIRPFIGGGAGVSLVGTFYGVIDYGANVIIPLTDKINADLSISMKSIISNQADSRSGIKIRIGAKF